MGDVIVVKNVDKDVYRRLKSVAALKGYTIGRALTEAMRLWLLLNEATSRRYLDYLMCRERSERRLREVERLHGEEYKGKYVVVCDGRLVKVCDDEEEARRAAVSSGATQCIIARIGEGVKEEVIELGMGVLE